MQVLVGANLIDGTGRPPTSNSAVLVNDEGRIEAVGQREAVEVPPDAEVIDVTGKVLLPGLIDCHDHLGFHGYDLPTRWGVNEPKSLQYMRTAKVLKDTLMTGYTTVRDAAFIDAGFKMAVEQGVIEGPRLLVAISPITPTGGIADWSSPSGHPPPTPDPALPSGVANGVEEIRARVRQMAQVGADVIKFASTGGTMARYGLGPRSNIYSPEEIKAVVDEAHMLGRKAMVHAHGGPGLRLAIEAGVDSVEHGMCLGEDVEGIKIMADNGAFFCPTLAVFTFHGTRGKPEQRQRIKELRPIHVAGIQKCLELGVRVIAGTDAGGWVHANNAQELECMVEAGLTPMQALQTGTGWAAEGLGLEKEIGTVEKGKLADLVVIDGDPLKDITILQDKSRIKLVMKEGTIFRNELVGEKVATIST